MKRFEYQAVEVSGLAMKEFPEIYGRNAEGRWQATVMILNRLGDQGWELITNNGSLYIFKREK